VSWKVLAFTPEENRDFVNAHRTKTKFLVDESLGHMVTEVLRELGYNTKDVFEVGLKGRSDEDVLAWAFREDRVLLTHDADFLDDRRFPPHRNPGIVVLPGAQGSDRPLISFIARMLPMIGRFRDVWRESKTVYDAAGRVKIISRDVSTGEMKTSLYRTSNNGEAMIWVED
jgi:predicted nuclease of predicted toxin-antitoxin system